MSVELPDWLSAAIDDAKRGHHRCADASEFSHGDGLTPPGLEDVPPTEGGRYHGRTPLIDPDIRMSRGQMSRARRHCQLEQSEGDFRRFASAIHQVACDV